MKNLLLLFLILPFCIKAQTVMLKLVQSQELSFEANNKDTTISKGESIVLGAGLNVFGGSGNYFFSWSPAASLNDSTIMNPVATPVDTTKYYLSVTDKNGCGFSLEYQVNVKGNPTSASLVKMDDSLLGVKIYPNPNSGTFKIQINGKPKKKIQLAVVDELGKLVEKKVIKNFSGEYEEEISLKLPAGSYSMLIHSELIKMHRQFIIK